MNAKSTSPSPTFSSSPASNAFCLQVKKDFPLLARPFNGKPLHYLDSAATTHKPKAVIDALSRFYGEEYATVRRGVYPMAEKSTAAYEGVRRRIAKFIGAQSPREIVFTHGATESLNLVAHGFGRALLKPGSIVLLSQMEHHANIVPWQMACEVSGARLKTIPCDDSGTLDLDAYRRLLQGGAAVVAVGHVSNALGTINPIAEMAQLAHAVGACIVVDGAQGISHGPVDVQSLDADFYAFSGHKMFGPTGVGGLYGKSAWLEKLPPFLGGGDMIQSVTFAKTTYQTPPHRFEAGTPPIAEVIGLGAALDWLEQTGMENIAAHEASLLSEGTALLQSIPGIRLIGTSPHKAAVISFVVEGVHPHDLGSLLGEEGVCIRAGHHCAQPTMERFGVPATARASLGPYNDSSDLQALATALEKAIRLFQ
jgi:cysteine desulfurase/selenocysteine lyase